MNPSRIWSVTAAFALFCATSAVSAESIKLRDLEITRAVATPTVPGAPTGAVYLSLVNRGKTADRLVAGTTPRAKRVEMHTMTMTGDVMRMREVEAIDAKPGESINMRPGTGHHLMLVGLTAPLKLGEKFPITLQFEKSGKVEIQVGVESLSMQPAQGHSHMH